MGKSDNEQEGREDRDDKEGEAVNIRSKSEYFNYHDRVLAKTTGGNVHDVSVQLSLVLNCIDYLDDSELKLKELQSEAIQVIFNETGVWP